MFWFDSADQCGERKSFVSSEGVKRSRSFGKSGNGISAMDDDDHGCQATSTDVAVCRVEVDLT